MHDLDRTQLETGESQYEAEQFLGQTLGQTGEAEQEAHGNTYELELASELLQTQHEPQLEQLLDQLVSHLTSRQFLDSPTARALGAILKHAARKALPVVAKQSGHYVPPSGQHEWGRRIGAAGQLFEMELEGLSSEDKEFELARRYVQWAADAATRAAQLAPRAQAPPSAIARQAATDAAYQHAPGLVDVIDPTGPRLTAPPAGSARSGRWVRRGRHLVVYM